MKKSIILALAILPSIVLMAACAYEPVFRSSINMSIDKTEARIGDTVTATVVWKNLNPVAIEVALPNWIVNKGGKSKKDMLYAVFTTQEDFNWRDELEPYDHTVVKRPKFLIKKDEEIKRTFKHTITEPEDLEVHAQAFFLYFAGENDDNVYDGKNRICYGQKTNNEPIKVQIKDQ